MKRQTKGDSKSEEIKLADSLKFALVGGLFDMIGDVLETYGAKLAIDEALKEQIEQQEVNKKQEQQMQLLEKKIEELQQQIEDLKKR
ncbi:hypothetical protein [Paenibacillus sp. FSL K6-1230]|uniref:hypothetical protein n=1 Tax=Paenibacillus sp. FSL K6-1230 TaxID=2921603 RepID=UPI0030F69FE0